MTVLSLLAFSVLGVTAPGAPVADTVLPVSPGQTVSLENFGGRIVVGTWDRPEVRIEREGDVRRMVSSSRSDARLRIRGRGRGGHPVGGRVELTVPTDQPLEIQGMHVDVRVEGTRGRLRLRSLHGSIELSSVSGDVEASTIHGTIRGRELRGRIRLRSTEEDVEVVGAGGTLRAQTVDGDVTLEEIRATEVRAESTDGDVRFSGGLSPGGSYRLSTHDGDLTVTLDAPVHARVSVSTFDGEFSADFPVVLERFSGGRDMSFTLGDGGAELSLEAFDGEIRLRRR